MTDIVERLRAEHHQRREQGGDYLTYGPGEPLMIEAADLIESLRAKTKDQTGWNAKAANRLAEVLSENHQLRAQLAPSPSRPGRPA